MADGRHMNLWCKEIVFKIKKLQYMLLQDNIQENDFNLRLN